MYTEGWQFSYFLRDASCFLDSSIGIDDDIKSIKLRNLFLSELLKLHLPDHEWSINGGRSNASSRGGILIDGKSNPHFWTTDKNILIDICSFKYSYNKITILPKDNPKYINNINRDEISLETFLYMPKIIQLINYWKETDSFLYWLDFYLSTPKVYLMDNIDREIISL